jgi:hypothetical protein
LKVITLSHSPIITLKYFVCLFIVQTAYGQATLEPFQADGMHGFRLTDGTVTVPAEYDKLSNDPLEFCVARKGKQFGIINPRGKVVVPFEYQQLAYLRQFSIAGRDADGLLRMDKPETILVIAQRQYKYGIINVLGKEVIPIRYAEVKYLPQSHVAVLDGAKWRLYDLEGRPASAEGYDLIGRGDDKTFWVSQNGLEGLLDAQKGTPILAAEYDAIHKDPVNYHQYIVIKGTKKGIFDTQTRELSWTGAVAESVVRTESVPELSAQFQRIEKTNTRKYGLKHAQRGQILPVAFDLILPQAGGRCLVVGQGNNSKALYDTLGRQLTPFEYQVLAINSPADLLVTYWREGEQGLLRITGEPASHETYTRVFSLGNGFYSATDAKSRMALLGPDGLRKTEHKYYGISKVSSGKIVASAMREDGSMICIDVNGKEVVCP